MRSSILNGEGTGHGEYGNDIVSNTDAERSVSAKKGSFILHRQGLFYLFQPFQAVLSANHGKVSMPKQYDALVIGSGTAGQSAAYELNRNGLTVAMVEHSQRPGGTCALSGCQAKKWSTA
jgi:hypothetical protein